MPEGDTIWRSAQTLSKWIGGKVVTAAESRVRNVLANQLVGATITDVSPRAKHLLITFSNGFVLHSHMRMTGSWHVYRAGEKWKKPNWQARIVITCDERVAVCFNAPVIELLDEREVKRHVAISGLGPDVLTDNFDTEEVLRRRAQVSANVLIGELLLDQRVVSGIGNIFRCESLFLESVDPFLEQGAISDETLRNLVMRARQLMLRCCPDDSNRDSFCAPDSRSEPFVYRRTSRPCRRCSTPIRSARLGRQARMAHWCPNCQSGDGSSAQKAVK